MRPTPAVATRSLEIAVAAAAVTWVALLLAAPELPASIAVVLYAGGSLICHQIPERSFHLHAFQLPVCARCFGLYSGAALGSVAAAIAADRGFARSVIDRRTLMTLAAAVPTAVTIVLEWGLGWPVSNVTRALCGAILASVGGFVLLASAALQARRSQQCPQRGAAPGPKAEPR